MNFLVYMYLGNENWKQQDQKDLSVYISISYIIVLYNISYIYRVYRVYCGVDRREEKEAEGRKKEGGVQWFNTCGLPLSREQTTGRMKANEGEEQKK